MKPVKVKKITAIPVSSSKKNAEKYLQINSERPQTSKEEKIRIINELAGMWADKDDSFFDLGKKP